MTPDQQAYLDDQIFSLTLMGTVQRAKIYREGSSESDREKFRRTLRAELEILARKYRDGVSDEVHLANIQYLADTLTAQHHKAMNGARFRIGAAQKALNLYLKYLWCLGRIPTPPHCPIDSVILAQIPGCENRRWTRLDSIAEYAATIRQAKAVARSMSLAEWELRLWNRA